MELKKIDAQEFATLPNFDVEYEDSAYAGEMSEKAYNVLASACDNAHSGYFEEMLQDLYLDQALLAREMDAKGAFARIVKRLEVVDAFRVSGNKPEWMIIDVLPVLVVAATWQISITIRAGRGVRRITPMRLSSTSWAPIAATRKA